MVVVESDPHEEATMDAGTAAEELTERIYRNARALNESLNRLRCYGMEEESNSVSRRADVLLLLSKLAAGEELDPWERRHLAEHLEQLEA